MSLIKFNYYYISSNDEIRKKIINFIETSFQNGITEFYQIPKTNNKIYMKLYKRENYDKGDLFSFQIFLSNKNIKEYVEVKDSGDFEREIKLSEEDSGLNKISKETLHFLVFIKDNQIKLMIEKVPFGIGLNTIKNFLTKKLDLNPKNEEIIFRLYYGNDIIRFLNNNKHKKLSLFRFKPYRNISDFEIMPSLESSLKGISEKTQEMEILLSWDKQDSKTLLEVFQDYFSLNEDEFDETFDFNDFLKIFTIKLEGESKPVNLKEKILFDQSLKDKSNYLVNDNEVLKLSNEMITHFQKQYSGGNLQNE